MAVELYGLDPDQFTAARNERAKEARAAGAIAVSNQIKTLRKPTLAAWLTNVLVRTDPDGVNDLTQLGDELRAAHLAADGARLRELTPRRHILVQELVTTARSRAKDRGRSVSQSVADRLTETLDAALIDPGAALLVRSGQLTSALRHVGFGVVDETGEPAKFAPMKPRAVRSTPTKRPAKQAAPPPPPALHQALERRRAELRTRAEESENEYAEAEAERAEAESLLDANQHQLADLTATIERLNEELEQARRQLRTAQRQTARLERSLDRATRTAAAAQRRRDTNHQRLADLDG
ncbi:hypothetical protein EV644_11933 [Kribbella orskensis]|uniref:Plasmid replication DNA-binding protein KfrA n=2 Tax=Kribbellaceae TaxID=2726069 RepID=A0ABY2BBB8_9ACTN|nr:hypothetical protein EV642_120110 [Kribbella sp. VKM Ac-2500]TCO14921.1 hypothetical protein EV644_11933 [Kribbella orskensis]